MIRKNDAEKPTLVMVIPHYLIPADGRVVMRVLVNTLQQLGASYHLKLTGRGNIFLNGSFMGNTHIEIKVKLSLW